MCPSHPGCGLVGGFARNGECHFASFSAATRTLRFVDNRDRILGHAIVDDGSREVAVDLSAVDSADIAADLRTVRWRVSFDGNCAEKGRRDTRLGKRMRGAEANRQSRNQQEPDANSRQHDAMVRTARARREVGKLALLTRSPYLMSLRSPLKAKRGLVRGGHWPATRINKTHAESLC